MNIAMVRNFSISLLATAILCFSSATAGDVDFIKKLEHAEQLWKSANLKKYSYTIKSGGAFGHSTYQISINEGECKARSRYAMGKKVSAWTKATCEGYTVDEIFDKLRQHLVQGVEKVEIEFDPTFGYIKFFYLEPETGLTDQTWCVEISKFKAKCSS